MADIHIDPQKSADTLFQDLKSGDRDHLNQAHQELYKIMHAPAAERDAALAKLTEQVRTDKSTQNKDVKIERDENGNPTSFVFHQDSLLPAFSKGSDTTLWKQGDDESPTGITERSSTSKGSQSYVDSHPEIFGP